MRSTLLWIKKKGCGVKGHTPYTSKTETETQVSSIIEQLREGTRISSLRLKTNPIPGAQN